MKELKVNSMGIEMNNLNFAKQKLCAADSALIEVVMRVMRNPAMKKRQGIRSQVLKHLDESQNQLSEAMQLIDTVIDETQNNKRRKEHE